MKTILVDADSLCFHAFDISLEQALETLENKIKNIKYITNSDDLVFFLTIGRNFRFDLLPTYKQNRDGNKRPEYTKELKQYLIDKYNAIQNSELEADDMVCDVYRSNPDKYMIASIDKDILYNMVGTHLNLYNMTIVETSVEYAYEHFHKQLIIGDVTDNIPSLCKGIGENRLKDISKISNKTYEEIAQYLCNRFNECYKTRYRLLYCGELNLDDIEIKEFEEDENIEYYIDKFVLKKKNLKIRKDDNQKLSKKISKINKYESENSKIGFGKYKDLTFKQLFIQDNRYYMWLYNETKDEYLKYILSILV